jgi:hypothetical protein
LCVTGFGCDPTASKTPLQFTQTSGDPNLDVNQFEFAAFVQNDFKVNNKFNLSFGARYEAQTNINDHNNLDPRMGFAYQLGKQTAIRGGVGIFHDRFSEPNVEQLIRLDGSRQSQIVVNNPTTFPIIPVGSALPPGSLRTRSGDLATPYNLNESISLEQALFKGLGVTFSWDGQRGIHLYRSRNLNAPLPDAPLQYVYDTLGNVISSYKLGPDGTKRNVYQLESTGLSKSNNFTIGMRDQIRSSKIQAQIFGSYTLGYTNNDTDGAFSLPVNSYDMHSEWGRSPQDTRHRFNTGMQIRWPWSITTTTQVNWNSSRPFNLTTGKDDNYDNTINDRPTYATLCQSPLLTLLKGIDCSSPSSQIISRNLGIGPGQFSVQTSLQKTWRLKGAERSPTNRAGNGGLNGVNNFAEPQRGGGGGGFPGGGFPGGGGGGDFGGQRGNGGGDFGGQRGGNRGNFPNGGNNRGQNGNFNQTTGPTVTFQMQVQNLLNNTQLNNFSGTMTSPYFGRASNARNARQVEVGLRFNF